MQFVDCKTRNCKKMLSRIKADCDFLQGTAILSGFRFSQFLDPLKDRPPEVQQCWFQHMQKVAASIVKQHLLQFEAGYYSVSSTVKSVLPRGGFSSLPLSSTAVAEDDDQKLEGKLSCVFSSGHMHYKSSIPLPENVSSEVCCCINKLYLDSFLYFISVLDYRVN